MNVARLRRLRQVLIDVQAQQKPFNMGSWVSTDHACGTAACALGYAALDPELRAQGLEMKSFEHQEETEDYAYGRAIVSLIEVGAFDDVDPVYKGASGLSAGAKFFEISGVQSELLFTSDGQNDAPADVIARIDALLAEHGA